MKKHKYNKVLFLIIVILFISFGAIVKARGSNKQNYISVTVSSGDTLWRIASEYTSSGKDVRKTIYEIRKYNKLDTARIVPGQEIVIPVSD